MFQSYSSKFGGSVIVLGAEIGILIFIISDHGFIITQALKCSNFSAKPLKMLLITRRFLTSAARTQNLFGIPIVDNAAKKFPRYFRGSL